MYDVSTFGSQAACDAILREVSKISPRLESETRVLLRRITTPNWTLEWGMPHWIGEAFRMDSEVVDDLTLANAYTLAYSRIADDLADGEGSPDALRLSIALYHLWMQCYLRLFAHRSIEESRWFWSYFRTHVTRWIAATLDSAAGGGGLADRGATLRIVCGSACIVAGRMEALAPLERATDDLMTGVVLLDDYFDWPHDLDAGRHNSFVAFCSELPQAKANRESNRRAVLHELCLADAASRFLGQITANIDSAYIAAREAGCEGLAHFAKWYWLECEQCASAARNEAARMISEFLSQVTA